MKSILKIISEEPNILKINSNISRNKGYVRSIKRDRKKIKV